ncbi:FMN-binding protein [Streptomyces sp. NBC_00620]|uniref:FMN-binding protein n=2 Tax=Streptomyces TaxID=1883 RepID=UPI00225AA4F2|nr:FMN-binding protein [Streptomyces sp. NBC_00620]MCX4975950.1 FMN-binding protein [Streptomyces sp. NBC_00620]WUC09913.1 FMN-binding protein [Streptomyces sp. NBC_00564]WUC53591.1 FMN-binding protein [Streptomyces sp. NBC_00554]
MKKSHPLRRVMLATAATVSGIVLLLSLKPGSDPASASAQGGAAQPPAAGQESPQGGGSEQAASGARTVTGSVADTQYGPVQVRLTLSGDKITKAEAVQAPSGGQSTTVTENAVPKLNQAAVAAGTADIDAVSGATYTSAGYKKSLQSALDQAAESAPAPAESSASPSQAPASPSAAAPEGQTVDGDVVQTQYGPVQVRLTLNGTTISKAEAIQAPSGGQSTEVTGNAIPKLNQAAAATQSADIDAVSGATYTSAGYKKSLQSALDKAGA